MFEIIGSDFIELESNSNELIKEIERYLKSCNVDICLCYSTKGKVTKKIFELNKSNIMIELLDIYKDELVNELLKEKKIVNKKVTLNLREKHILFSVIPLFKNKKLRAFICIGNSNNEKIRLNIEEMKEIIIKYKTEILEIEYNELGYDLLVRTITFIDEIFKNKSGFMSRHIYNVATWVNSIATKMNFSKERLRDIYIAALLHDIGKVFVDKSILNKNGKLTDKEYEEMKKHVLIGNSILNEIFAYNNDHIRRWILEHHEKWDGTGYPNNLKGEEISIEGRILKIADSIDAILSDRTYKKKKDIKDAIIELYRCKGKDFDPVITDVAIEILKERIKYLDYSIDGAIIPGKLIIRTQDNKYSIDGFIENKQNIIFKTLRPIENFEKKEIVDVSLVVEKLNVILDYLAKIELLDDNRVLLTDLKLITNNKNSFGLLWLLNGELVIPNSYEKINSIITKISGDNLQFNLIGEYELDTDKIYTMVVYFDDEKVALTGKITEKIDMNNNIHYNFEYTGLKDVYRDKVFKNLFRKQISMIKLLNSIA